MISEKRIYDDIYHLTNKIGVRLTGTENEKQAAEFMRDEFLKVVPKCEIEEFPINVRDIKKQELEILMDGEWVKIPVCAYNPSPSTNGETIEADLVYFDGHTDSKRDDWSYLTGKAVLHNGGMLAKNHYQRLMEAKPKYLLMVDTRYTSNECIANGMSISSIEKFGAVPIVNIAFTDAVRICAHNSTKARLTIEGGIKKGTSRNVIATLPGTDETGNILYFGAHIDSVSESVGADDNASGCGIILELARIMAKKPHKHTLKFIAFGAEEQLSEGSAYYVRKHRKELEEKGKFMCNFDSCCSSVGWYNFVINTDTETKDLIDKIYKDNDVYYLEDLTPDPYNDLFAFTASGVGGITHMRKNCEMGRFYHHQPGNSIEVLSMKVASELVKISADFMTYLADCENIENLSTNPDVLQDVNSKWENIYGGWNR